MTQEQAFERFEHEVGLELDSVIISWEADEDIGEWYEYALRALAFATVKSAKWNCGRWKELYENTDEGIKASVVGVLCNIITDTSMTQFVMTQGAYCRVLDLNQKMINKWYEISGPIQDKVANRLNMMNVNGSQLQKHINILRRGR
jgi:hypothetical protein